MWQIPVAAQSKAWFCVRSLARIVGSNPARDMDVCLLWVLCAVRYRSLLQNWSPIQRSPVRFGVSECDREAFIMRRPWPTRDCCAMEKKLLYVLLTCICLMAGVPTEMTFNTTPTVMTSQRDNTMRHDNALPVTCHSHCAPHRTMHMSYRSKTYTWNDVILVKRSMIHFLLLSVQETFLLHCLPHC